MGVGQMGPWRRCPNHSFTTLMKQYAPFKPSGGPFVAHPTRICVLGFIFLAVEFMSVAPNAWSVWDNPIVAVSSLANHIENRFVAP